MFSLISLYPSIPCPFLFNLQLEAWHCHPYVPNVTFDNPWKLVLITFQMYKQENPAHIKCKFHWEISTIGIFPRNRKIQQQIKSKFYYEVCIFSIKKKRRKGMKSLTNTSNLQKGVFLHGMDCSTAILFFKLT